MNIITGVSLFLFAVLFVSTLISYARRRDTLSRDVMLIFSSVAALFATVGVSAVGLRLPEPVVRTTLVVLFAQPLFSLRLAHQIHDVPRLIRMAALVAFVAGAAPLMVLPLETLAAVVLIAAGAFALTHLAAAWFLAREGAHRVGAARVRLGSAAAAGATMALAVLLVSFGSGLPLVPEFGRIMALAAATLYLLAFMPPAWVRKVWNAVATYEFTQALIGTEAQDSAAGVWKRAAELARRTSGAVAAIVVGGDPARVIAADLEPNARFALPEFRTVPGPVDEHLPLKTADGDLAEIAQAIGARHVSVLPIAGVHGERGALVIFRSRPSLFAADDQRIIGSLIDSAAIFAQRSEALTQQAALADRLAVTVQALEQASQAKSDFLASMSHELRTPLSAIIGFSALMRDEPIDGDRRRVPDEWIQHVHRSGEHLLSLINDVLDLTKIEAGRIQLERETFDLGSALAESVEGLRPLADKKQLEMSVELEPGSIVADRGRLRQIVYNLLSNAIKFTPEGGRICVQARWDRSAARIAVIDTGVGIDPADLERIFEEFSQVGDLKAREAGTGLGLALSRRLAEAHGGTLRVSSDLGAGSRFELYLPESRAESAQALQDRSRPRMPRPRAPPCSSSRTTREPCGCSAPTWRAKAIPSSLLRTAKPGSSRHVTRLRRPWSSTCCSPGLTGGKSCVV
jgi:signal transduction histidine kinase